MISSAEPLLNTRRRPCINIDNKLNSTYKAPKKLIYIQGGEVGASATPADHIVNKS